MRRLIPLIMCLFSVTQASAANQCSTVFPDGASTHSSGNNYDGSSRDAVQCNPSLNSASQFTVLSASAGVTCTNSIIEGDMGALGEITKTSCVHDGAVVEEVSQDIQDDFSAAYSALANVQCPIGNNLTKLVGEVLPPGTYCFDNASVNIGGTLTLEGSESDTWLFKIGTTGTGALTGTDFVVEMSGGANACNVTWWVSEDATITRGAFKGDILTGKEITVTGVAPTSTLTGRVMADGNIELTNADILYSCEEAASPAIDHYRIEHDGQGFTCEAQSVTIKACANESCDTLYDQETSITMSPIDWEGGNTLVFTGEITANLSVTDEGIITLAKTAANPETGLRCFSGSTETCDITFSNDGFEIYGANIGDLLSDQLAASNFLNVNLRAVRSNNNVCEALLAGTQDIDLTYDCDSPNQCLTPLSGISIMGDGTGGNTGSIEVEFNDQGVASLAVLNYPDAGRLTLSIQAEVEGVTVTNSDNETVDVYPSYLQLAVEQGELLYANSGEQNNYIAGVPFNVSIGAYGINDALLPNYQAENPQLKVTRAQPDSSGVNGIFKYSASGSSSAQLAASFTAASGLNFSGGEHQYALAYYDEVGRINVDVKDNTYLGNEILSSGSLTLGDFYPAYFDVIATVQPTLADTCGVFSYIGQSVGFETSPQLTVTAYNALDEITENYSGAYWSYLPDELTLEANLSYLDSSTYTSKGTASEVELGDAPVVSDNANYDGSGTVTIYNGLFQYNKVDTNNSAFNLVSPFDGSINLMFANVFFSTTFTGQSGSNTICYQDNYADASCNSLGIVNVIGTEIRYGRLELPSTYGPKTESLVVPIQAEYYDAGQWLLNTDDNCTSIAFDENADHIVLLPSGSADITGDINNISSTGTLLLGVADDGNDLLLNAPGIEGEVELQLDPRNDATGWSNHLNYDWNADSLINADDHPKATVTFGQFRGNDRIIHWRELFD